MLVLFGLEADRPEWKACVACVGTFDGVHLGHRELIRRTVAIGRETERPAVVVTFDRHPAATLAPDHKPPRLASLDQNLEALRALGVAATVVLPFNSAMAAMSAESFYADVLKSSLRAEALVVGHDFAFGRGRVGDPTWLCERIPTEVVAPIQVDGQRISSTRIRESIVAGDMVRATSLLGRHFAVAGAVVSGDKLGRKLGYPTANLARAADQITPAEGVYAGRARTLLGTFDAAISVGTRPAVGGVDLRIEAHLLDYPGESLYGTAIDLSFVQRTRGQEKFDGIDALIEQMGRDVEQVRGILASDSASKR